MAKTRLEILKDRYSFHTDNKKYLIPGGEILRYVGMDVALLEFTKQEDGTWKTEQKKANIVSLTDFEPMTMTYMCEYTVEDNPEILSVRIQPEGASFENPEETREAKQFMPLSKRFELIEDGMFLSRVAELYSTRQTLSFEDLQAISSSKDQAVQLRYSRNVGAAVRLDEDGTILYIRIHKLKLTHRNGTSYALRIENEDRSWTCMIDSKDTDYDFEGLGRMKIIDLMSTK